MRNFRLFSIACALLCVLGSADARPGGGSSMGSRGSRTWSAPPRTSITPGWTRPMDRTMTPQSNYGAQSAAPRPMAPMTPGYRPSFPNRHPFMTGFAGGLLGAGLFGILSGHGFFGGMTGGTSILGFLFQVFVIGALIMFAIRLFNRRQGASGSPAAAPFGAASSGNAPVTLSNDDYTSFQRLLLDIQSAWSAQNMRALSSMTTPEMAGYFNEQLSDLASRGARNIVSNIRFLRGDLSEAWRERNLTYATVAMQYSMTDVTTDSFGNVIDGSSTEPVTVTELWTFVRADGRGNWILSAIQQGG